MIGVAGQSKPRLLSRSSRPAAAAFRIGQDARCAAMSESGTFETCQQPLAMSAYWGRTEVTGCRSKRCFCDGFRMTAIETVRLAPGPSSESRQGTNPRVKCAEGAARSAMGIWATRKMCATIAMRSRASNGAPGGKQKQVLMVEVAVERGDRRFTLTLVRRIRVSVSATGRGPVR
jgi:hypothetical protein